MDYEVDRITFMIRVHNVLVGNGKSLYCLLQFSLKVSLALDNKLKSADGSSLQRLCLRKVMDIGRISKKKKRLFLRNQFHAEHM